MNVTEDSVWGLLECVIFSYSVFEGQVIFVSNIKTVHMKKSIFLCWKDLGVIARHLISIHGTKGSYFQGKGICEMIIG